MRAAGVAEAAGEHAVRGRDRRFVRLADDHALARGQAVGLDHERQPLRAHASRDRNSARVNVA